MDNILLYLGLSMELIENILWMMLIICLGFCGVFAPMLMPLFVKDEHKDRFPRYMDAAQPPYVYQSKWFRPAGVVLQQFIRPPIITWMKFKP